MTTSNHEIALVARVVDTRVVFPVTMEDEPTHTEANGYECSDPDCICHPHIVEGSIEREQAQERNRTIQCADGSWW